ncbi:sugar ABC transporter permease [Candidatus Bathyarchaeota archaeon]|nr:MAG: sugar ABC transporter permease [Candidatus Bathyarchaeota archaeon]
MAKVKLKTRDTLFAYSLFLPSLIIIVGTIGYPFAYAIWLSLLEKPVGFEATFVGLKNFQELINDAFFINSVKVTTIYMVGVLAGKFLLGLGIALYLNLKFRFRGVLRAILMIPWALPWVTTALLWFWMYNYQVGLLNQILNAIFGVKVVWLGPELALLSLILIDIWKGTPFWAIVTLAGLQTIPQELYEAASIDGAGSWQKFRHITLPGISGVLSILFCLSFVWAYMIFTPVYIITNGGPAFRTQSVLHRIYTELISRHSFTYSSAMAVIMMPLFLTAITILVILFRRRRGIS